MEQFEHYKKLRDPNYIGSYELTTGVNQYTDLNVLITDVKKEVIQNGDKTKNGMVLHFKGQKPMVVNATNSKTLSQLFGVNIYDWKGKHVTLFVNMIRAFGVDQPALRIRPTVPTIQQPTKEKQVFDPSSPKWNDAITSIKNGTMTIEKLKEVRIISPEHEKLLIDATQELI